MESSTFLTSSSSASRNSFASATQCASMPVSARVLLYRVAPVSLRIMFVKRVTLTFVSSKHSSCWAAASDMCLEAAEPKSRPLPWNERARVRGQVGVGEEVRRFVHADADVVPARALSRCKMTAHVIWVRSDARRTDRTKCMGFARGARKPHVSTMPCVVA
jgi:hypothetical protein